MNRSWLVVALCVATSWFPLLAQVCGATDLQLQHDVLPPNPTGQQAYAAIAGVGVGDRAAVVFDLRGLPGPIRVRRGGVLFGGTCVFGGVLAATANLEIYDGVQIMPNGQVLPGPRVYVSNTPLSLAPDTLTVSDISGFNVSVSSGLLMVAWQMVTNPNLPPPLCTTGFGADTTLPPGSPCATRPGINLIFDVVTQQWWDISRFRISGQPFCGPAYNGNWVIRACVELPATAYVGTRDGLELRTGIAGAAPSTVLAKAATTNNVVAMQLATPSGLYVGFPAFLAAEVHPAAGPRPTPVVPGAWLGSGLVPIGPLVFGAGNAVTRTLTIPPGSFDLVLLVQGVVLSPAAQNRVYATSDAHAVWTH